jgi:hypothetical protein
MPVGVGDGPEEVHGFPVDAPVLDLLGQGAAHALDLGEVGAGFVAAAGAAPVVVDAADPAVLGGARRTPATVAALALVEVSPAQHARSFGPGPLAGRLAHGCSSNPGWHWWLTHMAIGLALT